MDIIEMTRELAKKLQQEEAYILLNTTQRAVEEDDALQEAIADFNMKRYELTQEVTKKDRDDAKVDELDKLVRQMYDDITNSTICLNMFFIFFRWQPPATTLIPLKSPRRAADARAIAVPAAAAADKIERYRQWKNSKLQK